MGSLVLLPQEVDLDKCISLKTEYLDARLDLSKLPRLVESVIRIEGEVLADVRFETDLNGLRMVKGYADADVVLTCQRCGNEYVEHLEFEFALTPDLERARACNLEHKYDYIEFTENHKVDLYEFIEDGLLLEIPSVPRHYDDDENCTRHGYEWTYGEVDKEAAAKENPFAALAALKDNLKK